MKTSENERRARKGSTDHKLGMWNCGQLFAEQNTMPARWTGAQPTKPSSSLTKMLQRKVVYEYVRASVCVCMHVALSSLFPPPSPTLTRSHMYSETQMHNASNYHWPNCLKQEDKSNKKGKNNKNTYIIYFVYYYEVYKINKMKLTSCQALHWWIQMWDLH